MRCVAVLELERPELDTVIVWHDGNRLVAFAYSDGRVKMTRPLTGDSLTADVAEVCAAFQIPQNAVVRATQWGQAAKLPPPTPGPRPAARQAAPAAHAHID